MFYKRVIFKTVFAMGLGTGILFSQNVYVGPYEAESGFGNITSGCLDTIKSQKILFLSRSWGLGVVGSKGLGSLGSNYAIPLIQYWQQNGDTVPANAFDLSDIVHVIQDYAQPAERHEHLARYLRGAGSGYPDLSGSVDVAFQFLYNDQEYLVSRMWTNYSHQLDTLVQEFPDIKFAMCTHHCSAQEAADGAWNIQGQYYSDSVMNKYYGNLPIYDLRSFASIGSAGDTCTFEHQGRTYRRLCAEYATPDQIHLTSYTKMAKGIFVLLSELCCGSGPVTRARDVSRMIDPLLPQGITVYPNPSYGSFMVTAPVPVREIALFDRTGKQVLVLKPAGSTIHWKQLNPGIRDGVYFLKVNDEEVKQLVLMGR